MLALLYNMLVTCLPSTSWMTVMEVRSRYNTQFSAPELKEILPDTDVELLAHLEALVLEGRANSKDNKFQLARKENRIGFAHHHHSARPHLATLFHQEVTEPVCPLNAP